MCSSSLTCGQHWVTQGVSGGAGRTNTGTLQMHITIEWLIFHGVRCYLHVQGQQWMGRCPEGAWDVPGRWLVLGVPALVCTWLTKGGIHV